MANKEAKGDNINYDNDDDLSMTSLTTSKYSDLLTKTAKSGDNKTSKELEKSANSTNSQTRAGSDKSQTRN